MRNSGTIHDSLDIGADPGPAPTSGALSRFLFTVGGGAGGGEETRFAITTESAKGATPHHPPRRFASGRGPSLKKWRLPGRAPG